MDWEGGRRSDNVDDAPRGVGRPLAVGGGALGLVGFILYYLLTGTAPPIEQQPATYPPQTQQAQQPRSPAEEQEREFVRAVLGSTEDTWPAVLATVQRQYVPPRLTLFDGAVESACGFAEEAMGPFYCPPDQRVYLDLSFFEDLRRMGAPGDFGRAYVIAHEVGHHVQNLLGIERRVRVLRSQVADRASANAISVLTELQADCYAGIWAHHANAHYRSTDQRPLIKPSDIDSGFAAAASVGDDRLQRQATGRVAPESFTHGSSAQRVSWFRTGLETGDLRSCDTFGKAGVRL